ncbi:MAG: Y-family DNA polymerase [Cytophagaceae bacterium]|nr:MAG: Y-family DNA polymerase [Cytophagaceae bacterium]
MTRSTPYFRIKEQVRQQGIHVFSSTYPLYGDMSRRIFAIIGRFIERVEVYSIDEGFFDLTGYEAIYPDLRQLAQRIRETTLRSSRIPINIGIAPTKTLCKVATWFAKKHPEHRGICVLDTPAKIKEALHEFAVGDLWGIGDRYEQLLLQHGIQTAAQLRDAPDDWVRQFMTVTGLRLVYELRGQPCKALEIEPARKKSICTAPSFGTPVSALEPLREAVTTYLSRAAVKLRNQASAAAYITVFLHTNYFRTNDRQYSNSRTVKLPHPSCSDGELIRYGLAALESIYREGYNFQKVGILLTDLVDWDHRQYTIFEEEPDERWKRVYSAVDRINHRFGRGRVRLASQGYEESAWLMKQNFRSPCFTTRWSDILKVR